MSAVNPNSVALQRHTTFIDVPNNPGTIGSLAWGTMDNRYLLASAGFNGNVDLFTVTPTGRPHPQRPEVQEYQPALASSHILPAPCVCVQINSQTRQVYASQADGVIQCWSPETNQVTPIGSHTDICSNIRWMPEKNFLISSGYDGVVKYWDPRTNQLQGQIQQPTRIISMDANNNTCVFATDQKKVGVIDLRNPTQVAHMYDAQLEMDIVGVTCMYNDKGFVVASLDGRARVEYINTPANSFPFRAHREDPKGGWTEVHAFSAMTCHPQLNTLITGASDGCFISWDHENKSKVTTSERYPDPISALQFSPDGQVLAFATSYNWYKGAAGDPTKQPGYTGPKIGLFAVTEGNLKAKK